MALSIGSAAAGTGLAGLMRTKIQAAVGGDFQNTAAVQAIFDALADAIVTHVVANLEVKGIKTTLDASLNSIFSAGAPVPNDGGAALKTAWLAATAGGAKDDATQNNDGTGRVA